MSNPPAKKTGASLRSRDIFPFGVAVPGPVARGKGFRNLRNLPWAHDGCRRQAVNYCITPMFKPSPCQGRFLFLHEHRQVDMPHRRRCRGETPPRTSVRIDRLT